MRVLFVYPTYYLQESGVTSVIAEMSRELLKQGLSIGILTTDAFCQKGRPSTGEMLESRHGELTIYTFKVFQGLIGHKVYLPRDSFFWKARRIVESYDLVHLHEFRSIQNILVADCCRSLGVPLVLQPHGTMTLLSRNKLDKSLKMLFDTFWGKRILNSADKIVTLNDFEKSQFELRGLAQKVKIIPNGVDLDEYDHLPPKGSFKKKYGIGKNEKMILYVGRIYWVKGVDVLMEAFKIAVQSERNFNMKLVIVGRDDGYARTLAQLARESDLTEKVLITGPVSADDKLAAMVDADVVALPSRSEGFPMTLLEAYAVGRPVVTTNIGAFRSLVLRDVNGLSVEVGNAEQLSQTILFLLRNEERARKMGQNGRQLVERKFSFKKIAGIYRELYEEVLLGKSA